MGVLKRTTLIRALQNVYGARGVSHVDVIALCDFILAFFGYEDYVLDNVLSSPERDAFYDLEESGFLKTQREELTLPKGKIWRVNLWKLKKEEIDHMSKSVKVEEELQEKYENIFKQMEQNEEMRNQN
ncbi:MAG: hypothetical protein M1414_02140 [Candidatus Thermoplasmatota archaeon]|nr:hypothetical protein [Candidatus Thermoplasmatota archaeon]MCL5987687.1 hypothetical protein [Candidatus Thermoplasmatota archaeon]